MKYIFLCAALLAGGSLVHGSEDLGQYAGMSAEQAVVAATTGQTFQKKYDAIPSKAKPPKPQNSTPTTLGTKKQKTK